MKRWRNIAAAFAVALYAAGTAGAASVRLPDAAGTMLLLGRWESRYGAAMVVTAETMDGVPYRIERVCDDGWDTVVYLRLADEKKTELAFTLPRGNRRYVMKNNLTTGHFADAMDYVWKSRW